MTTDAPLGHGEDGKPVQITEFDYSAIEAAFQSDLEKFRSDAEKGEFSQDDVDRALAVMDKLLKWIWQGGMKNPNGLQIRAIIICWVFLKELRPIQLTDMARVFG